MSAGLVETLAEALSHRGITQAFGITGSGSSLALIGQLRKRGVKYHPVAHEAAAVMMAGACCRSGKALAAAIGIKGPGFANFFPGILCNAYENRPAVTVSEAYGDTVPAWRRHKRLDHRAVGSPVLKGYLSFDGSPSSVEALLDAAVREVPGPVHIDLCADPARPWEGIPKARASGGRTSGLEEAVALVRKSSRPALILGSLAARLLPGISWEIGVPVVTTAAAKGCLDETSDWAGGVLTGEVKELSPERVILEKADLIVAFGLRNTEVTIPRRFDAPLVIVDVPDAGEGLHEGFDPTLVLLAENLHEAGEVLAAELSRKSWGEGELKGRREKLEIELFGRGFMPAAVFRSLQDAMGMQGTLVLDTGLFCTTGETVWKARTPEGFCGSSNGRFMGTSIPTAIGVASGTEGLPVICVAGDGGIRPYLPEIRLAVEEKLQVLFVLMSDRAYGTIAQAAQADLEDRRAFTIGLPSWRRAVEGMGCPAVETSSLGEVEGAVSSWKGSPGPLFVEMFFDPEAYIQSTLKLR